jgi:membrane protein involved in colicin uptake
MVDTEMSNASPLKNSMNWNNQEVREARQRQRQRVLNNQRRFVEMQRQFAVAAGLARKVAAAKNADDAARKAAVEKSAAEAKVQRAEARAKREGSSNSNSNRNAAATATRAADKATATAKRAAANAARARAAANAARARAAANAARVRAAANAARVRAAANAARVRAAENAIVKNVKNKLKGIQNGSGSKENKNKNGKKIYRMATMKLHPDKGGNPESFKKLGKAYNNFQKDIKTKVTSGYNESWTG